MFASPSPIFADFSRNIGEYVKNALAVAGAGVVGYFLVVGVIWLIGRVALGKQPPKPVTRVLALLGGVACALFLAGFLSNLGGKGGWFGLGPGLGLGSGTNSQSNLEEMSQASTARTDHENKHTEVATPKTANPLRVRMLGGKDVKTEDGKLVIYQALPGNEAYTLDRLKSIIRDRMKDEPNRPAIKEIVIIIEKDSVAHNHDAVLKLQQFALDQGLTVTMQRPPSP